MTQLLKMENKYSKILISLPRHNYLVRKDMDVNEHMRD
jgi:hypothetical protein